MGIQLSDTDENFGFNEMVLSSPKGYKTLREKEKLLVTSNVFKSCLLLMLQNEYL